MITTGIITNDLAAGASAKSNGRSVFKIIEPSNASMGRMALKSVLQGNYQNYVSPFFVFDEFGPMELPQGAPFRVDAHPHAGIIPTTYLFKGNAHHRDSMGNDFQYHEGDFIQFTSGKGALHMEETGDDLFEHGGTFHGIQSWLNIPSHLKKAAPYAGKINKEDIPVYQAANLMIRVILGEVFGVRSKTELLMPVIYWHVTADQGAPIDLPVDKGQNAFIYMLKGQLRINEQETAHNGQAVLFERDGGLLHLKAEAAAEFLVLGGAVNNEHYAAAGPFVLNNEEELRQAYLDFEAGKFGDPAKTNGVRR
ncbi:hypothetical protein LX99_03070 [Mucilaginibacter oryzae]|uniref:Pirin family protein n=1 Tax=Mucilaginibacter oryzae TaxID=468058 RepID=A0A316H7X8_9SPHI|nr:pirin-like C-terminal cupin domain-containing protein [Mucilaginibacter oryzae]PWK77259.1 hypothetical protein LX99_03070 [Mucilaginibacter oryzae]